MSDNVAEVLLKEWEQFKSENDRRLKEIEKTGRADPLTQEKIDRHSAAIGEIQKQVDEIEKRANRPVLSPAEEQAQKSAEEHAQFQKFVRQEGLQAKAASAGSDAAGGFAIPSELDRAVGQIERAASPLSGIVTQIDVGNETYAKLFNIGGGTSGWVAETATRAETTAPSLAKVVPYFGELYANPAATQKILDDAFFDVEGWLSSEVGEAFGAAIDLAIANGSGSAQPKGVLQYTIVSTADSARTFGQVQYVASGSAADFEADDLFTLVHTLRPGYLPNARFVMNTLTTAKIRQFKDVTSGQYLWQPGLQSGVPATLLGYPLTEDGNLDVVGSDKFPVWFGDFRRFYAVANVRGMRMLRDTYTSKPYVFFYTTRRLGGGVMDSLAVKLLKCATS